MAFLRASTCKTPSLPNCKLSPRCHVLHHVVGISPQLADRPIGTAVHLSMIRRASSKLYVDTHTLATALGTWPRTHAVPCAQNRGLAHEPLFFRYPVLNWHVSRCWTPCTLYTSSPCRELLRPDQLAPPSHAKHTRFDLRTVTVY